MVAEGQDLSELEGIGDDLAGKIEEIVETGGLTQLEEIEARTPSGLTEMLDLAGLGPKRVQKIYHELGVTSLEELKLAAENEEIRALDGLGPKTEQKILDELERSEGEQERTRLDRAEELVKPLVSYLEQIEGVQQVAVAGSYRRRKETVGDLDILATGSQGEQIIARFVQFEDVEEIVSQGETRSTVLLRTGLQVDLRVVPEKSYGAALLYFTGSKAHNIHLRNLALDQGLKINEYGVFREEERIAGESEQEIYDLFDFPFIVPELREDRGEIQAAEQDELPKLVTVEHLRGDLQTHTEASDGHNTLAEMAQAARQRGYDYLAITDHPDYIGVTQGLSADEVAPRMAEIDELNDQWDDFRLLKGMEVDIMEDGELYLPDDVLERLDIVVASIHSKFDLSPEKQTERIIRAMDNPYFHIFAHPTGRRIGEREPYQLDMERVMEAAVERGCFLEINAHPSRLDLNDVYAKMAKEIGLKVTISTDAHRVVELGYIRYGVDQARRGWLEPDDVVNTRPWDEVKALLKR
jgi:DNA polymerase (family 10)